VSKAISIRQQLLWGLLLVAITGVVGIGVWSWQKGRPRQGGWEEKPLEGLSKTFGKAPDFSLIERSGRQLTLSDLKGKIWVVNFIYTNCPDTCPIQSAQMKELQAEFMDEKDLRLVSITVDPERDSPMVLTEYANRFGADPERWLFLAGEKEAIHRLAQEGFRLAAAEIPHAKRPASGATYTHSPRFALIDRKVQIRGYYTSTDSEAIVRLRRDLRTLLRARG
jgi:cytochrome oxidase Cu insertion factor (SCO1/SenC/PrrC family)